MPQSLNLASFIHDRFFGFFLFSRYLKLLEEPWRRKRWRLLAFNPRSINPSGYSETKELYVPLQIRRTLNARRLLSKVWLHINCVDFLVPCCCCFLCWMVLFFKLQPCVHGYVLIESIMDWRLPVSMINKLSVDSLFSCLFCSTLSSYWYISRHLHRIDTSSGAYGIKISSSQHIVNIYSVSHF
jgi:hypothetical protein